MVGATTVAALQVGQRCPMVHTSRAAVSMAAKYTDVSGADIKPAVSAYMHFCSERRTDLTGELKASMGASFANTAVMKELGAEWKKLDAATVARFKATAEQDKTRFDAAVASNPENAKVSTKRSSKASSDGKKKPLSSYMHFCADRRTSLTAELKASLGAGFANKMVMVKLGEEWRALDDGAKAKYVAMAEAQKAELAAAP